MIRAVVAALWAAVLFGADTKQPPVELAGPDTVDADRLVEGVEWQALNRTEKALSLRVNVVSAEEAVVATPLQLQLNSFGSATLSLKVPAEVVKAGTDFPVFVQLRTAKNELTAEKKVTVTRALPQIGVKELGGWQMRGLLSPLVSDAEVCLSLPLTELLPEPSRVPPGTMYARRSEGGAAQLRLTRTGPGIAQLCLIEPKAGTYSAELAPTWNGRPLGSVKVKHIVADGPILALLCALLGVWAAWYLKHALSVSRVAWGLRRRAAVAFQKFDTVTAPAFSDAVAGHAALEHLTLQPTALEKWKGVDQAAQSLDRALLVKIDDAALKSVDDRVKALESLGGQWLSFGQAQATLDNEYRRIVACEAASRAVRPPTCGGQPQFGVAVLGVLSLANVRPEEIATRLQITQTMTPAAREWVRVHDILLAMDGEWRTFDAAAATPRVRQLRAAARSAWRSAWNKLWNIVRTDEFQGLAALPVAVAKAIGDLQDERGMEADAGVHNAAANVAAVDVPVNPAAVAEEIGQGIEASEVTLFIAALALAVTAGMSTSYLGQPFGSLKNYVDLFLWGAGTKTGLDVLMPLVEQLSSLLPKAAK